VEMRVPLKSVVQDERASGRSRGTVIR
jgi:hypothetical protein